MWSLEILSTSDGVIFRLIRPTTRWEIISKQCNSLWLIILWGFYCVLYLRSWVLNLAFSFDLNLSNNDNVSGKLPVINEAKCVRLFEFFRQCFLAIPCSERTLAVLSLVNFTGNDLAALHCDGSNRSFQNKTIIGFKMAVDHYHAEIFR